MAVTLEGTTRRYIGLSTDVKPTEGVPVGSSFLESDTGRVSRLDRYGWQDPQAADRQLAVLELIHLELQQLNEKIDLVLG